MLATAFLVWFVALVVTGTLFVSVVVVQTVARRLGRRRQERTRRDRARAAARQSTPRPA